MADQEPNPPQGLGKSRFGRDPGPDYDNEDVRKQELQKLRDLAYHSVMKAFSEEFSVVSTVSSSKRRDITEKLIKELNISKETQISVKNKIQAEIHGVPQRADSSLTRSATPSPSAAPASGTSTTDVPESGLTATTVATSGSSPTTVPASGPSATTVPASGPSLAPSSGTSTTDVPESSSTDVPASDLTATTVATSGSSATAVTASGPSATTAPASGSSWGLIKPESLIGIHVHIKLSGDADTKEFVITDYDAEQDKHRVAYAGRNAMELEEHLAWIDLRKVPPQDQDEAEFDAHLN